MKLIYKRRIHLLLVISFLGFCTELSAQENKNFEFSSGAKYEVPDSLLIYDAIIIHKRIDVSYQRYQREYQKVKVLSEKALEEFSELQLVYLPKKMNVLKFDAQITKTDGRVIKYDSDGRFKSETNLEGNFNRDLNLRTLKLPITELEIGDIVEFIIDIDGAYSSKDIFFNDENYYTLKSELSVQPFGELFSFNVKQDPLKYKFNGADTYRWKLKNLPPLEQHYSNRYKEMPYIRFKFSDLSLLSVKWNLINLIGDMYYKSSSEMTVQRFIDIAIKNDQEASKYQKFLKVFEKINNEIDVKSVSDKDLRKSMGYYLEKGFIPQNYLYRLYKRVFNKLGMPIIVAGGKSKNSGNPEFYTDIFFFVKDDSDNLKILYPATKSKKYYIDECPVSLLGTKVDAQEAEDTKTVKQKNYVINMPESTPSLNFYKNQSKVQVNTTSNEISIMTRLLLSGDISTMYRSNYDMLSDNYKDTTLKMDIGFNEFELDTVFKIKQKTEFPFTASYNLDFYSDNQFVKVTDSLYSINLNNWITHGVVDIEDRIRRENFYIKTIFNDSQDYYILFDKDVEMIDNENFKISTESPFGKYDFMIEQKNPRTIIIHSSYKIYTDYLEKENVQYIRDLSDSYNKAKSNTLYLKMR